MRPVNLHSPFEPEALSQLAMYGYEPMVKCQMIHVYINTLPMRLIFTFYPLHYSLPVHLYDANMQVATIDHAMWFHQDFKMDDWLLYALIHRVLMVEEVMRADI